MGCFMGCFGGAKDRKRRKQKRGNRASPQRQRNRVENIQQENLITADQSIKETYPNNLDSKLSTDCQLEVAVSTDKEKQQDFKTSSELPSFSGDDNSATSSVGSHPSNLRNKTKGTEQFSPSPKKRVTFNSNITTYEHVPVHESIDFQKDDTTQGDSKTLSQSYSISEDDNSVASSVGSYPPNHRYHNTRDSDDEAEEYGDSDLDDMDDEDDEDYYADDYDEDMDFSIAGREVWSEAVAAASMESRTGNHSPQDINEEVEGPVGEPDEVFKAFGCSQANARDRSNYINSVLNPVENTTQWKAAKLRAQHLLNPQKENLVANFEPPRMSFSSEPTLPISSKAKPDKSKNAANQEIAVDASLSNWLSSPESSPSKKTNPNVLETIKSGQSLSERSTPVRSFEDRPILGALTVEELRQIPTSASPRKSPGRSPDETPIIGTVGTYWNHLGPAKNSGSAASSFKGVPNTTSKYREDKRVNWHSTPFEKRLDRALVRGTAKA